MDAALPVNEAQRLVALRSLNILDTPAEERFDRITRTAAGVFGVPIAALSLVDANRRWYKASVGLLERETPRDHAFCAHVLRAGEPLVIANVGADERYSDNPAVTGEPFIRFYAGHPLHSQAGLALGTLCIMDRVPRDFDERDGAVLRDLAAWAEDELNSRDLVRERELGRLQADLISTVAHELRTPLTAIMGYSDMLDGAEPGDTVTEYATIIRSNAQRLNALVSNLQDLSRIEAGQIKLQMQSVHVPDLVRNVLYTLEPEYQERGHRLHLDLAEDLPPVHADRRRLEQVITSLVSNAHKYTPPGGEIWVSTEARGGDVAVVIRDTGVGLTEEELGRLFTKFYRARNPATSEVGGAGLGLVIARALVAEHGGQVTVASEPDKGSTFTVLLPRSK